MRVVGKEYMDTPGAKIYASNHTSYFDVLPLMLGLGVPYHFVAKLEVRHMPFIGTFLKQMGHVWFDRKDGDARLRQQNKFNSCCSKANPFLFFLKALSRKKTAFAHFNSVHSKPRSARDAPIIPVSIAGSRQFLRDGTYLPRPTDVTLTLSPPIYPHGAAAQRSNSSRQHRTNPPTGTSSFASATKPARPSRNTPANRCSKNRNVAQRHDSPGVRSPCESSRML